MKNVLLIAVMMLGSLVFAQDTQIKPLFEKDNGLTKATYFHDNGAVAQTGFFKDGKVHGEWISYDRAGEKIAVGQYNKGVKTGKWFFWNGKQLSEVDYQDSRIAEITVWNNANSLVIRD